MSRRAWTANSAVRARFSRPLLAFLAAGWLTLAPGGTALADEHDHGAGGDAPEAAHLSREMSPVAKRAWKDLVCLCGRCARLTLAACRCPDAAVERQKVIDVLKQRDLTSQAAADAAYRAVMDSYIARFGGRHVLASENAAGAGDAGGFVALGALVLTIGGAIAVMEFRRRRGGQGARKARSRGRRRGA